MTRPRPRESIEELLAANVSRWLEIPGVLGAGIGARRGKACIKVFLRERSPSAEKAIPRSLGGYPVILEVTGEISALGGDGRGPRSGTKGD